jgi:hypothetical protein
MLRFSSEKSGKIRSGEDFGRLGNDATAGELEGLKRLALLFGERLEVVQTIQDAFQSLSEFLTEGVVMVLEKLFTEGGKGAEILVAHE